MNIRKNLTIFTIIKIPPCNLSNKSKKEFLKFSYTSIKVSMDYLKLQPKSIQNMNIRKNLIIFTITKIPPSNLPNKSKKEFLLNLKMKNYKLHQAFQKLSTMKRFCRSPNVIKILPAFQRLLSSHDYLRCQIKMKPSQKTKVQIISIYFQICQQTPNASKNGVKTNQSPTK